MSRLQRIILLLFGDIVAVNIASAIFLWIKFAGGTLTSVEASWRQLYPQAQTGPDLWYVLEYYSDVLPIICACWLLL